MPGRLPTSLIAALAILDEALLIILVVLGAIWLSTRLGLPITPLEAAIAVSPLALFLAIAFMKVVETLSKPPAIGFESMEGKVGVVRAIVEESRRLLVEIEGELWNAESKTGAKVGDKVVVVGVKGLTLIVEPLEGKRREVLG